jgi:hypothetical protein
VSELSPKALLDEAGKQRAPCRVRARKGAWMSGVVVRVERAGIILMLQDAPFHGGEDVRVWFSLDGRSYTFEASILRTGVPVPDRGRGGLLIGLVEDFREAQQEPTAADLAIEVLPPSGRGIELLAGTGQLVDLSIEGLSFVVPSEVALKFVAGGTVRVRFSGHGAPHLVTGRIRELAPGEGHFLYELPFSEVEDQQRHLDVVEAFRR